MSQTTAAPKRALRFPAEEPLMVRYSPHHEFPLSTVVSVALHVLVIGILIIGAVILKSLNYEGPDKKPVQMEVDQVKDEPLAVGGGGGNPNGGGRGGDGGDPGDETLPLPPDPDNHFDVSGGGGATIPELEKARANAVSLPENQVDDAAKHLITEGGQQVDKILRLKETVRKKLNQGLAAPKGQGGSGSGGGDGPGTGPGKGPGVGPGPGGNADPNKRAKRSLRWTLIFNTRDGQDYKRQLVAFGAILAVPDPEDPDGYLLIDDLKNPKRKAGDIGKIERLYWIDDKASSVRSLATALGIPPPSHFIVFFPRPFEDKLLRLELGYRGKQEEEITETRYEVRRHPDGSYEPFVISQR